MGGFATLHFGFAYPDRARSLVVGGCGYGAAPDKRQQFAQEAEAAAAQFEQLGMAKRAVGYGSGPTRVQFQNRTRAAGRNSSTSWLSIRPKAPQAPCVACKSAGRRCSTLSTR